MSALIEDLINLLQQINEDYIPLQEKITTKKNKKKKQKLKQRKVQQQKQEEAEQTTEESSEPVEEETADEDNEDVDTTKYELIVSYDEKIANQVENQTEYTQAFIEIITLLEQYGIDFKNKFIEIGNKWKSLGTDKGPTEEIVTKLQTLLKDTNTNLNNITTKYDSVVNDITDLEAQIFQNAFMAFQNYVSGFEQRVATLAPEQIVTTQDKNELQIQNDGEVIEGEVIDAEYEDITIDKILELSGEELKQLADSKRKNKNKDQSKEDKRTKKNIVTYKEWYELNSDIFDTFGDIIETIGDVLKKPVDWAINRLQGILNIFLKFKEIPVIQDLFKTLMCSNPFTAAIYNGMFGKLPKMELKQKAKTKDSKVETDKYGIPKNPKTMKSKQIKKHFYGNKEFIATINSLYNHTKVSIQDKADLKSLCSDIANNIQNNKDRKVLISKWIRLIDLINAISNDVGWDKLFVRSWSKLMNIKGTTEKEEEKINKKSNKIDYDDNLLSDFDQIKLKPLVRINNKRAVLSFTDKTEQNILIKYEDGDSETKTREQFEEYLGNLDIIQNTVKNKQESILVRNKHNLMYINEDMQTIANEVANDNKNGYDENYGNWIITTSLDDKWFKLTENIQHIILNEISKYIEKGLQYKDKIEIFLNTNDINKQDLESLDMFLDDEINLFLQKPELFYLSFYIDFNMEGLRK